MPCVVRPPVDLPFIPHAFDRVLASTSDRSWRCGVSTENRATQLTSDSPSCPPDNNNDGTVNVTDLLAPLAAWGPVVP